MKSTLASIFVLSLNLALAAQSRETMPATPAHPELTSTLSDADRVVSATNTDLDNLHVEKWSAGWKTAWVKKGAHKQQAAQAADALKELASGLPALIAEVRASHGNVGSAFKLYNHLTLACENMDALVEATRAYGKKQDYDHLSADYSNFLRVRGNLSTYVEQRAAVVDPRGNPGFGAAPVNASASNRDESSPAKKTTAKRKAVLRSSR